MDAILAGDLTGALAYRTPAGGVVVQAVAPIGLRDRERRDGRLHDVAGFSKKLDRIGRDPRVAMAYHAREHGFAGGPAYVLVQGARRVVAAPTEADSSRSARTPRPTSAPPPRAGSGTAGCASTTACACPSGSRSSGSWPGPTCGAPGEPAVLGAPVPGPAPDQAPPRNGTGPRVDVARVGRGWRRTRHTLLGWAGADGLPVVAPVIVARRRRRRPAT